MRCPAGQASLARHPGGAGAPPGSTKRPCQELADDRMAHAKRLRLLLPRRFPSARMERGRKRREDRRRGTYGESAARRSASHRKKGKRIGGAAWRRVFNLRYRASRFLSACWRAERRPRDLRRDRDAIGLRFSARHPFGGWMVGTLRFAHPTQTQQTPDAWNASRQRRSMSSCRDDATDSIPPPRGVGGIASGNRFAA